MPRNQRQWAKQGRRGYAGGPNGNSNSHNNSKAHHLPLVQPQETMWLEPMDGMPPQPNGQQATMIGPFCVPVSPGGKGDGSPSGPPGQHGEQGDVPQGQFLPVFTGAPFPGPEGQPLPDGHPMLLGGPGMAPLALPPRDDQDRWESCWEWVKTGWCPRGITCRWEHPPLAPQAFGGGMDMQQFWTGEGEIPPGAVLVPMPGGPDFGPSPEFGPGAGGPDFGPGPGVAMPPGGMPMQMVPDGQIVMPQEPLPDSRMQEENIPDGIRTPDE